jgi:CelD/BcsL family acetyltransferase involved in cellulose biosynthesis
VYRSEEARLPLKDLFVLYDQRWGKAEKLSYFIDQFAARSEHRDWLQVDILRVNGRDVAGLVHLRYQNTLSMYLMAVDLTYEKSISIGNILVGLSIERAITEGFGRYDFLRGTEDYKFHWSNEGRREVHLSWCGRKPKPFLWMAGRSVRALVKVAIR